ncbi:protein of unknown function [Geoalkalibacter ferrihydriticus]|uniref:PatA-like N-terminal domain-containing protein n=2 Tax=Geoalkalibacter ferrihydriticus TaxID=392333 RepID=A0A0C2HKM8_9BACT|nr:DUF4388 domain-containing protein [Geoalkalibacter ferrihydriticus]KIH75565.1 hypothetical protein GFER_15565 [Geoalkalibacter ferrihydriticus DSM 17813]SDL31766.1 protein of unknown function [Geoalkalibacter ferrihydriticus]
MPAATLDQQGRLYLPAPIARLFGARGLEITSVSAGHVLLTAEDAEHPTLVTGVLGEISVVDLLSFFNMFRKSGVLRFDLSGGRKDLYLQDGEIVAALSSFPSENLGEILFSLGRIEREVLERLGRRADNQNALVKFLLEKNLVSASDIWQAVRHQAEIIVYDLLTFQQGSFSFQQKSLSQKDPFQLSMSTQNLLMEGLRRLDERQLFLRLVPSLEAFPRIVGQATDGLSQSEAQICKQIQSGDLSVREVIRRSGFGEFDGLRVLYHLVERGQVVIEEAASGVSPGELGLILDAFNDGLAILFREVSRIKADFRQEIQDLLRELPQPYSYILRDARLREDGTLDSRRILANLAGLEEGDKMRLLADALGELLYMECHTARQVLGEKKSAEAIAAVKAATGRAKAILGRN